MCSSRMGSSMSCWEDTTPSPNDQNLEPSSGLSGGDHSEMGTPSDEKSIELVEPTDELSVEFKGDSPSSADGSPHTAATDIPLPTDVEDHPSPATILQEDSIFSEVATQIMPGRGGAASGDLNLIKIILRSSGNQKRDTLRMRRVYGLLTTYHGVDRFAIYVFEGSRRYHLEFPNDTTGYCPELHTHLINLVGDANIQIEPLRLQ